MSKPYAFINEEMQTYATLKAKLGSAVESGSKFDMLNAHIRNAVVMPGNVIIVGDSTTQSCTGEEAELMKLATHVRSGLRDNNAGADGHVIKNYDLLQQLMGYGAIGIGASMGAWSSHLKGIETTLKEIETLHQKLRVKINPVARNQFITERRLLFSKLDTQLEGFARYGSGLKNASSIKKMLGISTKSYLHTGEISGYAKIISGAAKASRFLKSGTYIGVLLNVGAASLEIQEACSTGREDRCTKIKYVEGSKLALGLAAGAYIGTAGAKFGTLGCLRLGVTAYGLAAISCAIIGGVVGGIMGGNSGEVTGEYVGEKIYETVEQ